MAVVLAVVGGSGGVGASTFATALATVAGRSVLIDLDPVSGGIDVLLGIEDLPGARWSGLRVDGGYLDPALLRDGLPCRDEVAVLAADEPPPSPEAVAQLVGAAAELGPVVLDLPRGPSAIRAAALSACTLCCLVVAAEIPGLVAAAALVRSLRHEAGVPVGAVLRRGGMEPDEAAPLLGVPLLGVLPAAEHASTRATLRVAAGVLDGVTGVGAGGAAVGVGA